MDNDRARMFRLCVNCLVVVLLGCLGCGQEATDRSNSSSSEPIVISRKDEEAIKKLLEEFRSHANQVSHESRLHPYLDCDAHRELIEYGWKAVPYLIEQAAQKQAVDAYLGAALINDARITTPEQVMAFNRERRKKVSDATLFPAVLATVLRGTPAGKEAPDLGQPKRVPGTRMVGIHYTDSFAWIEWWQTNKSRFRFKTKAPVEIPVPEKDVYYHPHLTTSVSNGLLNLHAVSATYHDIIERAAAEMGIEVFIGKQQHMEGSTTLRMKSVNFDEFLYIAGQSVSLQGFKHRKTGTGYGSGARNLPNREDTPWAGALRCTAQCSARARKSR
jgi:hypothetical protein